ncbi:MAG: recombinase RecA, partial [Planctomycetia bacterium]
AWISYGDVRLGQGRENAKQFLKDNPELYAELRAKILAKRMTEPAAAVPVVDDGEIDDDGEILDDEAPVANGRAKGR